MSAPRRVTATGEQISIGTGTAHYFSSSNGPLSGWLNQPTERASKLGLVICNPFGYEATCAHRSVRAFAEMAAQAGIPTLRFDYIGTGDSADLSPERDQLEAWTADTLAAITTLQQLSGVRRVCLMGIRLGGLIALQAARQFDGGMPLLLIAPTLDGLRYLRQLRTAKLATLLKTGDQDVPDIDGQTDQEFNGFTFSAASIRHLNALRAEPPAPTADAPMLVIDGNSLPTSRTWTEQSGPHAKYLALPGLVEMVMRSPLRAEVPTAMIAAARTWLGECAARLGPLAPADVTNEPPPATLPSISLADGPDASSTVTERPVLIRADVALFGVLSERATRDPVQQAVVLLNTGADYHVGPNRLHVALARQWARRGIAVLRLDLGGLGDSETAFGSRDDEVFPNAAIEEIRAAVNFMLARYDLKQVIVGGLCSGAYHALQAAISGLPVSQIFLVNPQNYFWKPGSAISDLQLAEVVSKPSEYSQRLFYLQTWRRLFRGDVSIPKILSVFAMRVLLAGESIAREIARRLRIPMPQDLGVALEGVASHGVRMLFVFAAGEPGIELLKLQGGSSVNRLGAQCRLHIVAGGDHIFSEHAHREAMMQLLTRELFR